MKLKVVNLVNGLTSAHFMWEEKYVEKNLAGEPVEKKRKITRVYALNEVFELPDYAGAQLLGQYPGTLKFVAYSGMEAEEPKERKRKMIDTAPVTHDLSEI